MVTSGKPGRRCGTLRLPRAGALWRSRSIALLIVPGVMAVSAAGAPAQTPGTPATPGIHRGATPPAASSQPASQRVLVVLGTFRALRVDPGLTWLGEGIQQTILADLSSLAGLVVEPLDATRVTEAAVLAEGRRLGARAMVVGTYQTLGGEVRAVARVLEASGTVLGVASARVTQDRLGELQDSLAKQIRELLSGLVDGGAPAASPPSSVQVPPAASGGSPAPGGSVLPPAIAPGGSTAAPVPFEGSALQRALAEEDAGRRGRRGPAGVTEPGRGASGLGGNASASPGGWAGGGQTWGAMSGGWGYSYGVPGYWGFVPVYVPPRPGTAAAPGGNGAGGGLSGSGTGAGGGGSGSFGAAGSGGGSALPGSGGPGGSSSGGRPPLIYPGTTPPPSMPPGMGQP